MVVWESGAKIAKREQGLCRDQRRR